MASQLAKDFECLLGDDVFNTKWSGSPANKVNIFIEQPTLSIKWDSYQFRCTQKRPFERVR